ncbi:hypothetical protein WEI85_19515 [Actinomycetes bacterium KLBMP 9797]
MNTDISRLVALNQAQYRPGQRTGHYESFYQRANHPTEPLAFWIRYTIFSPHQRPEAAIGELWAVFFDGTTGQHAVVKQEYPIAECAFDRTAPATARVGDSVLAPGRLRGGGTSLGDSIEWDLTYTGDQPPLYLLPHRLYRGGVPKAKSLVGTPAARYRGVLSVNGRAIEVSDWIGSQNHNWGSRHTDHYAFGQVAGFDGHPDSFLEVVTARAKLGPLTLPFMTFVVVRHDGREHSLVSLAQARRADAGFGYFHWDFSSASDAVRLTGRITARPADFVGLNYYNPPGGIKHCLNTKIGSCRLEITNLRTGSQQTLHADGRALFEILTDDRSHDIPIRA